MPRRLNKLEIILLLALGVFALPPSFLFSESLDGTEWRMRERGARFWSTDDLGFHEDQFISDEGRKDGFAPSSYAASKDGERVTWNAEQTNDKGEKVEWSGVSMNNRMDGTYTRTKSNGKTVTRQWTAELKTPAAEPK